MQYELRGGPDDGEMVDFVDAPSPVAVAMKKCGPDSGVAGTFDTSAFPAPQTYALYAFCAFDEPPFFLFAGITDQFARYLQRVVECRQCHQKRLAVLPEQVEYPLQCAACEKMAAWPAVATP